MRKLRRVMPGECRCARLAVLLSCACVLGGAAAREGHAASSKTAAERDPQVMPLNLRSMRLADGAVFVPKPAQFRLGLRAERVRVGRQEADRALQGIIVADPNHSAIVASTEQGLLDAGASGFPVTGSRVKQGQVLAWLQPLITEADRVRRRAALARVERDLLINEQSLAQLGVQLQGQSRMAGTNLFRDNLLTERKTLQISKQQIQRSLAGRIAIRAPISGEVSLTAAQIGVLVEPGQTLFEIIDPARLWVKAQSYEVIPPEQIGVARARTRNGDVLALEFAGQGMQTRDQSLPLDFRIVEPPQQIYPIYIGQPVSVTLRAATAIEGIVLPQSGVTGTAGGGARVWLQTGAERFVARPVKVHRLPGGRVRVDAGLAAGERVVVYGGWLLDQVRW